jgi:hypothetical protein
MRPVQLSSQARPTAIVDHRAPPEKKIALFRSLFRGRDDVYPRRFESRRTGKAGYQPNCANEWVEGICAKPRVKCSDCPYQRFLPVTDEAVRWHLSGRDDAGKDFVMGIYPMLQDETCFFLAADFDKEGWREDAKAFRERCRLLNIPVALERSRSGNGAHVWIFFEEAIPASLARKLGSHILTEAMENRPDIGLRSYDRLFSNQDTLPKGGFGNLIALPLQGGRKASGNSVFLDEDLIPYARKAEAETAVLCELIAESYERRSLVITCNQPFGTWETIFLDKAMTVAAIDRLVHHATILEFNTESYRRPAAAQARQAAS